MGFNSGFKGLNTTGCFLPRLKRGFVEATMILTLVSKRVMQGCRLNSSGWRMITVISFYGSVIDGCFLIVWASVRLLRTTVPRMFR